jgi:hypothetical protein
MWHNSFAAQSLRARVWPDRPRRDAAEARRPPSLIDAASDSDAEADENEPTFYWRDRNNVQDLVARIEIEANRWVELRMHSDDTARPNSPLPPLPPIEVQASPEREAACALLDLLDEADRKDWPNPPSEYMCPLR